MKTGLEPLGLALFAFYLGKIIRKIAYKPYYGGQVIEKNHHLSRKTQLCGPSGEGSCPFRRCRTRNGLGGRETEKNDYL